MTPTAVSIAAGASSHVHTAKPSIPSGYVPFCVRRYDASYGSNYPLIANTIDLDADGIVDMQLKNVGSSTINAKINATILVIKSAVY